MACSSDLYLYAASFSIPVPWTLPFSYTFKVLTQANIMNNENNTSQDSFDDKSPTRGRDDITSYLHSREKDKPDQEDRTKRTRNETTAVTPSQDAKKQRKEFVLSSDEESDDEGEDKPVIEFPFTVLPVQNNALPGFVFYATGFADKYMAEIQYDRNKKGKKNYLKFIKFVECVEHVNSVLEQGSKTLVRKKDAEGKYPYKAWVKTYAPGTQITAELVQEFLQDEFVPNFMKLIGDQLRDNQIPGFTDRTMELPVTNWSDAVIPHDLTFIFTDFEKRFVKKNLRIGSWIRQSSDNLYAIYTRGQLPKNVYRGYNIPDDILDPLDKQYFDSKKKAK